MANVYYSAAWLNKSDGEIVTYDGGTYTIGTDAFGLYADAKAASETKGWFLKSADLYYSAEWKDLADGTSVTVVNPSGTFSTTIGNADIPAYSTFDSAMTAAKTADTTLAIVGGTWTMGGRNNWYGITNTVMTNSRITGTANGAIVTMMPNAHSAAYESTFTVGEGAFLSSIGITGNDNGSTFNKITYNVKDGGHIGTIYTIGYRSVINGDLDINISNGGKVDLMSSAVTDGSLNGNVNVVLTNNSIINSLRFQPDVNGSTITLTTGHSFNITLDGSTIGTLYLDSSQSRVFSKAEGATVNMMVTGCTTSYIGNWQSNFFDSLTIDAGASLIITGSNFAHTGTITIDAANCDYTQESYLILSAGSEITNEITVINNDPTKHYGVARIDNNVYYQSSFVAERFAVTSDQSVMLIDGGTYADPDYYSGYGGAGEVQNGGSLIGNNVIFAGNTAKYGGAIYNAGTITLASATFSDNSAKYGGAIYNTGTITFAGDVILSTANDTLYSTGTLNWRLAGGTAGYLSDYALLKNTGALTITVDASPVIGSYRLAGNAAGAAGKSFTLSVSGESATTLTVGGDVTPRGNRNYQLAVIDNELTLTITQGYERFVIASGQTASLAAGTYCNPCYYEGNGAAGEVRGTLIGENVAFSGNTAMYDGGAIYNSRGNITLKNAAFFGNTSYGSGGAIRGYYSTITLTGSTISGNTAMYDGGAIDTYGANLTLNDVSFSGNTATSNGGAIFSNSNTLTLTGATLCDNMAGSNGGAVYNTNGATITDVIFVGNTTKTNGGAIYNASSATLTNVSFTDNTATSNGGAIYSSGNTIALTGATFSCNTASSGGAFCCSRQAILTDVIFTGNTATSYGGAIYNDYATTSLMNVGVSDNSASQGGAIYTKGGTLTLNDVNFSGNTAGSTGGAICSSLTVIAVTDVTFSDNMAITSGGAIYASYGTITLTGATFSGNTAASDGGALYSDRATTLTDVIFTDNTAASNGGAIYSNGGTGILTDVTFNNNTATQGGAIYNYGGLFTMTDVTFSANTATTGGAIYNGNNKTITLADVTFTGNTATSNGGAIYNTGSINLTGTVTLATESDTWENADSASINWDISNAVEENAVCVNGFQYFSNGNGATQTITVNAFQATGDYVIATGDLNDLTGKNTFTLKATNDDTGVTLTVGDQAILYNDLYYYATVNYDRLILHISTDDPCFARFVVTSGQTVSLANDIFCNPDFYDGNGAAGEVQSSGTLVGENLSFTGNTANYGGAILNQGNATLSNATFNGNMAGTHGGAIYNAEGGTATIFKSTFAGNSALRGGAIDNDDTMTLSDSVFISNTASEGGAIHNEDATISLTSATFTGNTSSGSGGAIFNSYSSTVSLQDMIFSGNTGLNGGAIHSKSSSATLQNAIFTGNVASWHGGAIDNYLHTTTTLTDVSFSGNTASYGGAIFNEDAVITLTNVTLSGNIASEGGAIYNLSGCINLSGAVTLATASDTWANYSTANWDLTQATSENAVCLNGFQYFSNQDDAKLTITVNADQTMGNYVIATGDFSDVTNKNTFTLTGVDGQNDVTVTIGGEMVKYGTRQYTLAVAENDLTLSITSDFVFYNRLWESGAEVAVTFGGGTYTGTVGDGMFYNNFADASAQAQELGVSVVTMGSGIVTKPFSTNGVDVMLAGDAVYKRMVLGGELQAGSHEYTGSYTFEIAAGTFCREVAAGDASNKYVDRTGDITFNISGGVFNGGVFGGSYYANTGFTLGTAGLIGDIDFTISGGTFTNRIYGGCGSMTEAISSRAAMDGDVNLTIDATTNAIAIGEHVVAGNRGYGLLVGSTNVKVTGYGANLTFADSSVLFGGCSGDYYKVKSGVRTAVSSVIDPEDLTSAGVRALVFDEFTGDFNAEIRMFSDISLENNTNVNFADAKLDLKEVSNWNFDCTSCATNLNKNLFAGDTINVDTTNWTEDWTLLSGDAAAFADLGSASSVTLGGVAATYANGAWSTENFTLALENDTELVISKLA